MIKRILSAFVAMIMIMIPLGIVQAEDAVEMTPTGIPSINPYYTDEYSIIIFTGGRADFITSPSLTISSGSVGQLTVATSVRTEETMKKLGFTALKVQHWNGSSWVDVWTITNNFTYNTTLFSYLTYLDDMTSNDYYRVSVDLYAKKGFLQVQTLTLVSNYIRCL